jgi:hypothetical protein
LANAAAVVVLMTRRFGAIELELASFGGAGDTISSVLVEIAEVLVASPLTGVVLAPISLGIFWTVASLLDSVPSIGEVVLASAVEAISGVVVDGSSA